MISHSKWLLAAVGAAAAFTFGAPAALAGTVVAVTGPSAGQYPVGKQIGDTQRITLAAGDRLTVLDASGTRVLTGPGTFILARQGARVTNSALSALTQQRQARTARVASSRTAETGEGPTRPNIWYVDVAKSGRMCVSDPTAVRLWRGDTESDASFTISAVAQPASPVALTFHAGEMLAGWDSRIALAEGLIYSIRPQENAPAVQIDFVFLDEIPEDPEALAAKLVELGCMGQVEVLANSPDLRS